MPDWSKWPDLPERVRERTVIDPDTGCHVWQRALNHKGYGYITLRADGEKRNYRVHRITYELANGPIPEDRQIDHLCRTRACCNPEHLEAVTASENMRRSWAAVGAERFARRNGSRRGGRRRASSTSTHCMRGHELTPDNTYVYRSRQLCKACRAYYKRLYRAGKSIASLKTTGLAA